MYFIDPKKSTDVNQQPSFIDMVYTDKYFNNIESPGVLPQKFTQHVKRHKRKNRVNRQIMALNPSPYQSKDAKLKEIKKTYGLSYKNMFDQAASSNLTSTVRPNKNHK